MENQNVKKQIQVAAKKFLDTLLYVLALVIAFGMGFYYKNVKGVEKNDVQNAFASPKSINNISVSVTDRNELMIIDRQTQLIEVYQDSVGFRIFNAYASTMIAEDE